MVLSSHLFWDIDKATLCWEEHKAFVIRRVFERGTTPDFVTIINHYGREECKNVMLNTRSMGKRTLSFCSVYFKTDQSLFRCSEAKQSHHIHWNC